MNIMNFYSPSYFRIIAGNDCTNFKLIYLVTLIGQHSNLTSNESAYKKGIVEICNFIKLNNPKIGITKKQIKSFFNCKRSFYFLSFNSIKIPYSSFEIFSAVCTLIDTLEVARKECISNTNKHSTKGVVVCRDKLIANLYDLLATADLNDKLNNDRQRILFRKFAEANNCCRFIK